MGPREGFSQIRVSSWWQLPSRLRYGDWSKVDELCSGEDHQTAEAVPGADTGREAVQHRGGQDPATRGLPILSRKPMENPTSG